MRALISSEKLCSLVSNIQIPRFSLIIYNPCNWSDPFALISCDKIIFSRNLTCSSVVRLYSCRSLNCCSFGALYGLTLVTYDGTDLGSPEGSTERTTDGNIEVLMLGNWLVSLYGIDIGTNVGNELGFYDEKVIGTKLGNLVGL